MDNSKGTRSTKDKILETALKLFSQKGYLGATTKEIAKEAGIAEVTLFRHFPSKENLFEEVINTHSFLPALKELMPEIATMSYEKALTVIAKRFLETLSSRKDLIQIMHSEMQRYPEKIHKIYHAFIDEIFKILASYFAEMQKKKILKGFDTEFGARAFLGMFFSYFNVHEMMMHKKYRHLDKDTTIKEFVKIFVRGTKK
ncbi:MAG: TetR/AcrR family transcriptional regulator [Nitrospirae bacterium]|nr:TetR/AcrR family transcriptional regulator [Nitrospirota bacterium]MCL5062455.1 TetR/AcrR family transcriptional regulator [Nitrospirota bacterium]MDA8340174.1 TetR/AcrR family transcriptional regulator [Nitrospiraceae bacterium]